MIVALILYFVINKLKSEKEEKCNHKVNKEKTRQSIRYAENPHDKADFWG